MIDLRQTLETNLGLILTPKIDLSLKILAMNIVEIEQQIKEIAESNPLVKIDDNTIIKKQPMVEDKTKELDEAFREKFSAEESVSDIIEATIQTLESLQNSLLKQLKYEMDLDEVEDEIARQIVFNLDEKGFLSVEPERIAEELSVPINRVETIRKKIMSLEPIGCGALSSKEFIILQATLEDRELGEVVERVLRSIEETNRYDIKKIKKLSNLDDRTFDEVWSKIKSYMLSPLENYQIHEGNTYIQPDVYVKKIEGKLVAILEDRYLNTVSIDEEVVKRYLKDQSAKEYVKEKYRQVKELLLAISNRNKTLLKTVNIILEKQRRFFEDGTLMPLTRKEIAEMLNFNVSTITRAVANKYMEYEGKIIPLSKMFTSGLSENISKEYVKSLIQEIINNENKQNPLSDDQIRERLAKRNIELTRRTVTKYRKEMNIPSSRERRWQDLNQR